MQNENRHTYTLAMRERANDKRVLRKNNSAKLRTIACPLRTTTMKKRRAPLYSVCRDTSKLQRRWPQCMVAKTAAAIAGVG